MGASKLYKRRKRRRMKSSHRSEHKLIGGRTGGKRFKQRKGLLHELKRRKA